MVYQSDVISDEGAKREWGVNPQLCRNCNPERSRRGVRRPTTIHPEPGKMITQEQERQHFIVNWRKKSPADRPQVIQEIASWHRESNRHKAKGIDYYIYELDEDGKFISPANGQNITANINQQCSLGWIETKVVEEEEKQVSQGEDILGWISPLSKNIYPDLKLTVTRRVICEGREYFENRAILFDLDEKESLEFAQKIASFSKKRPLLSSLEEIRCTTLVFDRHLDWIEILVEVTGDEELGEIIRTGADKKAKAEALEKADKFYNDLLREPTMELKVENNDFYTSYGFGEDLSSCPVILISYSVSETLSNSSATEKYWRRGDCRLCGKSNTEVGPCQVCKKCEEVDNQQSSLLARAA